MNEEDKNKEVQNQEEGQPQDLNNQDPQPKGKSKEENFDGVVKKLNAKEKELKQMKARLAELESQPKGDPDKVASIEAQLQQLLNEQKNIKLEREFERIDLNPKYSRASQALLEGIAEENDLDLSTTQGIREATKKFAEEYPDLLNKKKDVGTPSGMNGDNSPVLKALDGDASEFFKLSKEERAELARKARSK